MIVGVVGAGTMGAGIAQVAAQAGHQTLIFDADGARAKRAVADVTSVLGRLAERGKITPAEAALAAERLVVADSLDDFGPCGLVVEAVVESLEVKQSVLAAIAELVAPSTILATNTSSISIDAIAGGLPDPARCVGMHFFNPAPVMRLVEVVYGTATEPATVDAVCALAEAWGKVPVRVRSSPGFIVNRVARPYYGEAHRLVEERAAEPAVIDAVMRDAGGFRMGPLELTDLIGQDVSLAVSTSIWEATGLDPRYAPSTYQRSLVEAGRLGRKTGRGVYSYPTTGLTDEGHRQSNDAAPALLTEGALHPRRFRLKGTFSRTSNAGLLGPLVDRLRAAGAEVEAGDTPGMELASGGLVRLTDGRPATLVAGELGQPVVVIDLALDYATAPRLAIASAVDCPHDVWSEVVNLLAAAAIDAAVIDDTPGLIVMRTVARLVNEAVDLAERGVASGADVDRAMKAGANYPLGPLEWADRVGLPTILTVLDHLEDVYRDGRYRPSPFLRRRAAAAGGKLPHDT